MFIDRLVRGWELTKASLNVLRTDTEILVLPVLSGVVMVLLAAGILGATALAVLGGHASTAVIAGALLLTYFVGYFVVIFFNAAVVAMATMRFEGQQPKVKDGLRASRENWLLILQWALVAATVGLLLRLLRGELRQRYGWLADLLVGGLEFAWNGLVYFVVPLLVFRKMGPMSAIKESGHLIRRAWGETVAGEISMGAIFVALGVLGFVALLGTLYLGAGLLVSLAVLVAVLLYWAILAVVYSAAQGVLTAALYKYATTGQVPHGFDQRLMSGAVA